MKKMMSLKRLSRNVQPGIAPDSEFARRLAGQIDLACGRQSGWWGHFGSRCVKMAGVLAAMLLIAVGAYVLLDQSASPATADYHAVLDSVRQARSVAYDHRWECGDRTYQASMLFTSTGQARIVDDRGVQTMDVSIGKSIHLYTSTKRARITQYPVPGQFDLGIISEALPHWASEVSRETVNGVETIVYLAPHSELDLYVWTDARTHLPVRIESRAKDSPVRSIIENIRWNVPVSAADFPLDVPEGYTLVDPNEGVNEEALVTLLKVSVRLHQGKFPPALSERSAWDLIEMVATPTDLTPRRQKTVITGMMDSITSLEGEAENVFRQAWPGCKFINARKDSFRYVGAGLSPGDGAQPICWWQDKDPATRRVVFGDYSIRTVAADQLPGK